MGPASHFGFMRKQGVMGTDLTTLGTGGLG